ncbi:MAG: hypothetical protein ACO35E_09195 [Ilumatobacteraceae bacterium]
MSETPNPSFEGTSMLTTPLYTISAAVEVVIAIDSAKAACNPA